MKTPPLPVGSLVSFGLWHGHAPCKVAKLDRKSRLPSVLEVTETIPGVCKLSARITLDAVFWQDLPTDDAWREIRPGVWFAPLKKGA